MDDFKTPLAIVVAYDKQFTGGLSIYEDLYHLLCRNANEPLIDGLDIPVYFQTNQEDGIIYDVRKTINADKEWYCCWLIFICSIVLLGQITSMNWSMTIRMGW